MINESLWIHFHLIFQYWHQLVCERSIELSWGVQLVQFHCDWFDADFSCVLDDAPPCSWIQYGHFGDRVWDPFATTTSPSWYTDTPHLLLSSDFGNDHFRSKTKLSTSPSSAPRRDWTEWRGFVAPFKKRQSWRKISTQFRHTSPPGWRPQGAGCRLRLNSCRCAKIMRRVFKSSIIF